MLYLEWLSMFAPTCCRSLGLQDDGLVSGIVQKVKGEYNPNLNVLYLE